MIRSHFQNTCVGGCWIFFVLSGFLNGLSFSNSKYKINLKGTLRFYKNRIVKTFLPTLTFIFVSCILCYPEFLYNNPSVIIQFIFLTYRGNPSVTGIGATWFVFCITNLWILTPFIACMYKKSHIENSKVKLAIIYVALIISSLIVRNHLYITNANWNDDVYVKFYMNIDLYFGGFTFAYILKASEYKYLNDGMNLNGHRLFTKLLFLITILINCFIYNKVAFSANPIWFRIYGYYFQTIYLLVSCYYLWANYRPNVSYQKVSFEAIKQNPFRLVDLFAKISFEFYLLHSMILDRISTYIPLTNGTILHHLLLVMCTFVITSIMASGYHKIFSYK